MRTFVLLQIAALICFVQSPAQAGVDYTGVICQGVEVDTCLEAIEEKPLVAVNVGLRLANDFFDQIEADPTSADVQAFNELFGMSRDGRISALMDGGNTRAHQFFMFYEPSMILADMALEQVVARRDRLQAALDHGSCGIGVCSALESSLRSTQDKIDFLIAAIQEVEDELQAAVDVLNTIESVSSG